MQCKKNDEIKNLNHNLKLCVLLFVRKKKEKKEKKKT